MSGWRFLLDENIDPKTEHIWRRKGSTLSTSVMRSGKESMTKQMCYRMPENTN